MMGFNALQYIQETGGNMPTLSFLDITRTALRGMPEKHLKYIEQRGWDARYFRDQADRIDPSATWAIDEILASKQILEQTYNACLGVIRLEKKYGSERLENACARAQTTHRVNYGIIRNILNNGMDHKPLKTQQELFKTVRHENIRGPAQYE